MKLFSVHAEREQEEAFGPRVWFVIAGSPFDAISLVPDGFSVKAVEVHPAAVPGPGRVIGWMGESAITLRSAFADLRPDSGK